MQKEVHTMILKYKGHLINIDDDILKDYRDLTGMDVDESYIPYWASNENVNQDEMSDDELAELVKRGIRTEMEIAAIM